jgi:hypothetical protein
VKTWPAILIALTLVLASCEYLPISSGQLEGTVTPLPDDWTAVAAPDIIQLETNPAEPYSVNLWIIGDGEDLYVHAGANRAAWVEHIEQDPRVRLGIEGRLFELRAERVTSADEFRRFSDKWEAKYGSRPRNENVAEAYLFRLLPR